MYSTASPPPKKEGAKSITPSESKGGKPPTVWQRLSVLWQMTPASATSTTKKRQEILPLFAFYQNYSAGTNPGHHFPLCARTASRLSLAPRAQG